jgi:prolyl 4-hydroxylase
MNSWISRETSPIFDAVYRRAADLMRIDESLMRRRDDDELPDWPSKESIAESLQLVHYEPGQLYTAHHGTCILSVRFAFTRYDLC